MSQRLVDYAIVLGIVLILMALFKLSRYMLHRITDSVKSRKGIFTRDDALALGMGFLLCGLLLLPFVTAILTFVDNTHLVGGMVLHLGLTAVSVVLFSFAEDLFRDYNSYGGDSNQAISWHTRKILPLLLVFWLVGCLFLSPLFYSGLTILTAVFYRICLHFRKEPSKAVKTKNA